MPTNSATPADDNDVFLVTGVEPEVAAYAMAKYSRSALSMRESLREIDGQKAEKFLNTFYFQYGHRSIADLAHLSFALERLSILAAIEVADETRWDGQERSTRYQEFRKSGFVTPPGLSAAESAEFIARVQALFDAYEALTAQVIEYLVSTIARPDDMKPESYQRTLRARAFDVSRYLLPLATRTSLGQIVSARALEQQICRLLSSAYPECRNLGESLRRAASAPGAAPTLVKYTAASEYLVETRSALRQAAAELMKSAEPIRAATVTLVEPPTLEIELAATLLYSHCHFSYRQLVEAVAALDADRRAELVRLGTANRGRHDELSREFQAGQPFQFDILMDIGGFRDLHRHRRCVQIHQDFTAEHGYEMPEAITACGQNAAYRAIMDSTGAWTQTPAGTIYALPLGYRKRSLFKMDLAQVAYIAELRTAPAGHFSYREAAWQMYVALRERHPLLAEDLRVTDPNLPSDPLQR